ncbi:hypothetical protein MKW98_023100 [Papaver atlanticum]|uniref:Uncharacterized protein n=1 Tax=Papaver atlanticum TaxID=357466 RepID=A0AAD4T7P3_9MAGN|nr:hypothetical protein MKW98_023100 [Papaver atlanticum]
MSITKGRSPGILAASHLLVLLICLSVCTKIASAYWENVCYPGEIYVERNFNPANTCDVCTNWCSSQCSGMRGLVVKNPCGVFSSIQFVNCQCCCRLPSSPPIPVPAPPTPPNFSEDNDLNICTSGQKYIQIADTVSTTCSQKSLCEKRCNAQGLTSVRDECFGHFDVQQTEYTWLEQCCCVPPSPPPPTPSPPPPPPPSNICELPSAQYFQLRGSCGDCQVNCKSICSALGGSVERSRCTSRLLLFSGPCQCCCNTPPPPPCILNP